MTRVQIFRTSQSQIKFLNGKYYGNTLRTDNLQFDFPTIFQCSGFRIHAIIKLSVGYREIKLTHKNIYYEFWWAKELKFTVTVTETNSRYGLTKRIPILTRPRHTLTIFTFNYNCRNAYRSNRALTAKSFFLNKRGMLLLVSSANNLIMRVLERTFYWFAELLNKPTV